MTKRVLEVGVGTAQQSQYHYPSSTPQPTVYINIDQRLFPHVNVQVDLTDGLPFKDQTFTGIFSSHCFEHLSFVTAHQLLREMYRVLAYLGTMVLLLPNFAYWATRYQAEGLTDAVCTNLFGQQLYPGDFHRSGWDPDSLVGACRTVGFQSLHVPGCTKDELSIWALKQEV